MGLLDSVEWQGNVFKGGAWTEGRGGDYAVVEPATGDELGRIGQATAEDVAEAAAGAAGAQREWAATAAPARAAVLRQAGDLWAEHADEISGWNVREVGAIAPAWPGFALHVAAAGVLRGGRAAEPPVRRAAAQRAAAAVDGAPGPGRRGRRRSRRSTCRSSSASARWPRRWRSATP